MLFILFLFAFSANAMLVSEFDSNHIYIDTVYDQHIKTIQIHSIGLPLSYPVIALNSGQQLEVRFDDLGNVDRNFEFTLVHCNSDWRQSNQLKINYIEGFATSDLVDVAVSSGTYQSYNHHYFQIPNDDLTAINFSGNYAVILYNQDTKKVMATLRMMVVEDRVNIDAKVKIPNQPKYSADHQQVTCKLTNTGIASVLPPMVMILQNGLWHQSKAENQPNRFEGNAMLFDGLEQFIFKGGNEYRLLDLRSNTPVGVSKFETVGLKDIIHLSQDAKRGFQSYSQTTDLNGKQVIGLERTEQPNIESDYVQVQFYTNASILEASHLVGYFNFNQPSVVSKLSLDPNREGVQTVQLYLKQGIYDYKFVHQYGKNVSQDISEGNYSVTENDYMILVYQIPPGEEYEHLVGYKVVSSKSLRGE